MPKHHSLAAAEEKVVLHRHLAPERNLYKIQNRKRGISILLSNRKFKYSVLPPLNAMQFLLTRFRSNSK